MKLYGIFPKLDHPYNSTVSELQIEAVADLVMEHIAHDPALFAVCHKAEISQNPVQLDLDFGYAKGAKIHEATELKKILIALGNPSSGKWILIRSLITCRMVHYGQDGQAFVALPSDAPAIVSPDDSILTTKEMSEDIISSDIADGLIASDEYDRWNIS
jgi:hypothetical protein